MQVWERSPGGADTSFFDTVWGAIDEVSQANDVFKVLMQLELLASVGMQSAAHAQMQNAYTCCRLSPCNIAMSTATRETEI